MGTRSQVRSYRTSRRRWAGALAAAAGALSALALAPARPAQAQSPGPPVELDPPVANAPAWGNQVRPRVAVGSNAIAVVWHEARYPYLIEAAPMDGALLSAEGAFVAPLEPLGLGDSYSFDVAACERGFVVVSHSGNEFRFVRLDAAGVLLDATPQPLAPFDQSVSLLKLACTDLCRCVAVWRTVESWQLEVLHSMGFGWNSTSTAVQTLAEAQGPHASISLALTASADKLTLAHVESVDTVAPLRVQHLGDQGLPVDAGVEISPSAVSSALVISTQGAGYALSWVDQTADGNSVELVRLDERLDPLASIPLPLSAPPDAVTSTSNETLLWFSSWKGVSALALDAAGGLNDLGVLIPAPYEHITAASAGDHPLVIGALDTPLGSDVFGAVLEPPVPAAWHERLSQASNSQWGPHVAPARAGASPFVAWSDNRSDVADVYGVTFDDNGCPAGPVQVIVEGEGAQEVVAMSSRSDGFSVLSHERLGGNTRWVLAHLDPAGAPRQAPVRLDALSGDLGIEPGSWSAGAEGSFVGLTADGVVSIDPSGQVSLTAFRGSDPFYVGALDGGAVALVSREGGEMCATGLRVDFLDADGGELRAPLELGNVDCSFPSFAFAIDGRHLLIWQDTTAWRAMWIARDAELDGPHELRLAGVGDSTLVVQVAQIGSELWWLLVDVTTDPATGYQAAGTKRIERTSLALEDLGTVELPSLGRLVPTATGASLLTSQRAWAPSSLRLVSLRLDGGTCAPPPPGDGGAAGSPSATADSAEQSPGCACRAAPAPAHPGAALLFALSLVLVRRLRRAIARSPAAGWTSRTPGKGASPRA